MKRVWKGMGRGWSYDLGGVEGSHIAWGRVRRKV